jgi:hypothetical protein
MPLVDFIVVSFSTWVCPGTRKLSYHLVAKIIPADTLHKGPVGRVGQQGLRLFTKHAAISLSRKILFLGFGFLVCE